MKLDTANRGTIKILRNEAQTISGEKGGYDVRARIVAGALYNLNLYLSGRGSGSQEGKRQPEPNEIMHTVNSIITYTSTLTLNVMHVMGNSKERVSRESIWSYLKSVHT